MLDLAYYSPKLAMFDWTQCRHETIHKSGFTRPPNRRQRLRCIKCGKTFIAGQTSNEINRVMIGKQLMVPSSTRESVARALGFSSMTVRRVAKILVGKLPLCECGRSHGHKGWCAPRFNRSPKRQAFMKRWVSLN